MLRHLVRSFHHVLTLQPATKTTLLPINQVLQRTLFHVENSTTATVEGDSSLVEPTATNESDSEYIVPYRVEREKRMFGYALVEALSTRYRLTTDDVKRVMRDETIQKSYRERSLISTLEALCLEGVTKSSFLEYPWLITIDKTRLDLKLSLIRSMPVMRDINHFVPFFRLTVPRLRKLVSSLKSETTTVPFGNRVYYISEKLQIQPSVVTKYLSNRLFILEMPFEMLEMNLQHMIAYNVSPLNILKDLWAFRYTPKSVQLRLERAKRAKKDKIMPWMVRCPEPILQRSLKLSLDELAVLGDKTSVVEYVAERLQFDVDGAKAIMAKHPKVNRVRVTKIKEVLDYLLDEAGFSRYEIAQVPRILCHGLDTTKQRIEELKSYGCRPTSLVIVCRSKREYDKFVKAWLGNQKYINKATEEGVGKDDRSSPT